ncbi:hypothetical protein [Nocardioides sp. KR10-350]|uniref:hypothetical protein n=1 Tax=Nocardioides cheoyonin TaxID=3156615 RepID=UPI0032B36A69
MATRSERVVLTLEDNFSTGMAKAAAQTALLERALKDLDGTSTKTGRSTSSASTDIEKTGTAARKSSADINQLSGRLNLLAQTAVTLGPALIPIGAVGLPAVTGLAAGLGAAAGAAGVAMLAFHGVGDALDALNKYQAEPTAENLAAMQEEFRKVGPAAADFVRYIDSLSPELEGLQRIAGRGIFPGFESGIRSLLTLLPQVRAVVASISDEIGRLGADAGASLANDDDWQRFFDYIRTDAAPTLDAFARATGNVAAGLASLMVDFAPMSRDFSGGLLEMSRAFRQWADGLGETEGFEEFLAYIRENGPAVREFLVAAADALVGVAKAAAPWGATVLPILTSAAKVFAALANSPVGPLLYDAAAGMLVLNRASSLLGPSLTKASTGLTGLRTTIPQMRTDFGTLATTWMTAGTTTEREAARVGAASERLRGNLARLGPAAKTAAGAGGIMLLADSANRADRSLGVLEATAGGALAGAAFGGWGAVIGGAAGLLVGLGQSADQTSQYVQELAGTYDQLTGAMTNNTRALVAQTLEQDGALKAAQALGLNLQTVLNAALGDSADRSQLASAYIRDYNAAYNEFDKDAAGRLGNWDKLNKQINFNADSVDSAGAAARREAAAMGGAASATGKYGSAASGASGDTRTLAQQVKAATSAMQAHRQAALGAFDAETQWRQALVAARQQAASNSAGIRGNSDAALANRSALSQLAAAWNNQSDAVKNNNARFKEARSAFVQTATAMGVPIGKARQLASALLEIPKSRVVNVTVNTGDATSRISAVYQQLASLHDKTITVNVAQHRTSSGTTGGPFYTPADGMTIPGSRAPYRDQVPILAAPGEEVVSNRYGQADRWRPLLKAINANMLADGGTVQRLADGGTAGGSTTSNRSGLGQLAGINHAYLSAAELGQRLDNLSNVQIRRLSKSFDNLSLKSLKKLDKAFDDAVETARDAKQDARDAYAQAKENRSSLASSVADSLRSDLWGQQSSNVFAGGAGSDPLSILRSDIAHSRQQNTLEKSLIGKGISDAVLSDVASNGGLAGLQQISGYSRAQVRQLNSLYAQRQRLSTQAGATAANAVYGDEIKQQTRALDTANRHLAAIQSENKQLRKQLKAAEKTADKSRHSAAEHGGRATGKAVNSAAASGKRRQKRGGTYKANH